jgi:energy-coupling factor transport system permease protein
MRVEQLLWPCMPGSAYEFRFVDSPVHRLKTGYKLGIAAALSITAFTARDWNTLALLLIVNLSLYLISRLRMVDLWRDIRFFLIQGLIVLVLYMIRYGGAAGFPAGLRVSLQILLFFMPSALFLRTTGSLQITTSLRRIFSPRFSFVILCSFRFIPFFAREFREIAMAQRLRGAPLAARQLLNPKNWKYAVDCLFIPLIVRAMHMADEVSLSAEARGMPSMETSIANKYLEVNAQAQESEP